MDTIVFNLDEECKHAIEEAAKKNQYSGTPIEETLKRLVPIMLQEASYEERQLFYRMLRTTPILAIPEGLEYTHKALVDGIFQNINTNVEVLAHEKDPYEKMAGAAAFVSRPSFSKDG